MNMFYTKKDERYLDQKRRERDRATPTSDMGYVSTTWVDTGSSYSSGDSCVSSDSGSCGGDGGGDGGGD